MSEIEKELVSFINENNLNPFNKARSEISKKGESIFKTRDAKAIHTKTIGKIAENFFFSETRNLIDFFSLTQDIEEIKRRQHFFKSIEKNLENSFLKNLKTPEKKWHPSYGILVVTEDEKTLIELKKLDIPVKFITSSEDIETLENYDLIQVIDCDESRMALERLPQTVFLSSLSEVYLERYLEVLSGWRENIKILEENKTTQAIKEIIDFLKPLLFLITKNQETEKLTREIAEEKLEEMNENVSEKMKTLSISGSEMFEMLSKNSLPKEVLSIIEAEIETSELPEDIFNKALPITLDEKELSKILKEQEANKFLNQAEKIKLHSKQLKEIPSKLKHIENLLLLFDFYSGISKFIKEDSLFHEESKDFTIYNSRNLFLDKPQPISFSLDETNRCSILTGANSGGKTTLLEHLIQLISLFQLGLPVSGNVKLPLFSEVYYFAKNKGSTSKGAFETLLTQMSEIKTGDKTLILADEIESVTEPGVAGKIVCATSEYFLSKGCFLVIATHLGREIQANLPKGARIDGIEAKGLDENFDLIVDHNPVLGRLANSTPELIIEKMANSKDNKSPYLQHIFKSVIK